MPELNKETKSIPCVKDPTALIGFHGPHGGKYVLLNLDYGVTREPTNDGETKNVGSCMREKNIFDIDRQPQASKAYFSLSAAVIGLNRMF